MEPPYQENQENQLWKKTGLDSAKSKILAESKFPNFPVTNFQNQQNQLSKRTGLTSLNLGQNLGPEQPELGPKLGPGPLYQENQTTGLTSLDLGQNLGPEQPEPGPKLGPGPPYQEPKPENQNPKKILRKRGRRLGPKLKRSKRLLAKPTFSETKIWP